MQQLHPIHDRTANGHEVTTPSNPAKVLDVLNKPACRKILRAVGTTPLTAKELEEESDVPLSTIYRCLDELAEASLLEETVRMNGRGRHPSQYTRRVSDVVVSLEQEDGVSMTFLLTPE
jgi:Fe2+ or Zn2+ uptake regulation protein